MQSAELSVLAAEAPGQPSTPTTQTQGDSVVISWSVPDDGAA
jgi:hypothetical protein